MAKPLDRRSLLVRGGALTPVLGAAALMSPALTSPAAAAGHRPERLAGTWAVTVTIPDLPSNPPELGIFAFTGDGLMMGTSGGDKTVGFGTWRRTGLDTYTWDYRHFLIDADNNITGDIRVTQNGVLSSPAEFTADGPALAYDLNGDLLATRQSHSVGTRYGFEV
jgi:hypothetical protein